MSPEKFDEDKVPVEGEGIEDFTVAIGSGELRDSIAHLDTPGGVQGLRAYENGEKKKAANQHTQRGREATGNTGALDISEYTQGDCHQPGGYEAGATFWQAHGARHRKPQYRGPEREGQCSYAKFCPRFHHFRL